MSFRKVWSATGVVALTGALLLTTAPTASADYIRDRQWALSAFAAEDVWAKSQGAGVTVAVVDSGVDATHPDLTGQVLEGKDFTDGRDAHEDLVGHGTKMASIIAGHGHGSGGTSGVMGMAPKAKILPLRTLQTRKDKNLEETWGPAVRYAVDQGAKVINLSFGSDGGSKTTSDGREAIAYAQAHDVVVVAAAGNEASIAVIEPAALPGVVSVGAVDQDANVWTDSNTGKGLALTAPGVDIVGANNTMSNGYGVSSGTSEATAYVSAAAALVRSKFPELSAGQVINRLIKSATLKQHEGLTAPNEEYGYGIVRPYSALTMDIPVGPKNNPLGQLEEDPAASGASENENSSQAQEGDSFTSKVVVIGGGIATVVIVSVIVFAVVRSRRGRNGGGPGPGGGMPSYGSSYQQYPMAPGQSAQYPNPHAQQPPSQDR
ncbi:type VII secretion-associated serine protease mycosin [Streptomyces sp. ISL-12]|uniref:type VII secretion-associated serine protease mycosin n=1 Tax=Streptomyces sp. ISL-12 TaxID=2819177 RepID=UPI001BE8D86B|nr:type VII secretion-associated serine protease mycosin [Streptomyces sp. ISL-12]MBT2413103.1 type VII secretion-associated serine protease mycosin [Streptomyces sp. ISL-12]